MWEMGDVYYIMYPGGSGLLFSVDTYLRLRNIPAYTSFC
jgi:hypothetical protein